MGFALFKPETGKTMQTVTIFSLDADRLRVPLWFLALRSNFQTNFQLTTTEKDVILRSMALNFIPLPGYMAEICTGAETWRRFGETRWGLAWCAFVEPTPPILETRQ
jgi:hypothetical protein